MSILTQVWCADAFRNNFPTTSMLLKRFKIFWWRQPPLALYEFSETNATWRLISSFRICQLAESRVWNSRECSDTAGGALGSHGHQGSQRRQRHLPRAPRCCSQRAPAQRKRGWKRLRSHQAGALTRAPGHWGCFTEPANNTGKRSWKWPRLAVTGTRALCILLPWIRPIFMTYNMTCKKNKILLLNSLKIAASYSKPKRSF